jgi:hypothetical protein
MDKIYLNKPKLYNTGFLVNDNESRKKQGLMSQDISNNWSVNINEKNLLTNPYYNNKFFPLRGIYVDYQLPIIKNTCSCVRNIQAP